MLIHKVCVFGFWFGDKIDQPPRPRMGASAGRQGGWLLLTQGEANASAQALWKSQVQVEKPSMIVL